MTTDDSDDSLHQDSLESEARHGRCDTADRKISRGAGGDGCEEIPCVWEGKRV